MSKSIYHLEPADYMQAAPHQLLLLEFRQSWAGWHHDYELLLVKRGRFHIQWYAGAEILSPGDMIFFRGNMLHQLIPIDGPAVAVMNRFSGGMVQQFSNTMRLDLLSGRIMPPVLAPVRDAADKMLGTLYAEKTGYQFLRAGLLYEILGRLEGQNPKRSPEIWHGSALGRVQRMIDCILSDITAPWSPERAAGFLEISTASLQRNVREITGMSFLQLLQSLRIDQAKRLLIYSGVPINQVAQAYGFGSAPSFYRCFRRMTGTNPMEYQHRAVAWKEAPFGAVALSGEEAESFLVHSG